MKAPKTAYVLLWFPEPTETFLFREVLGLWRLGLDLEVHTIYGPLRSRLSAAMRGLERPVHRLGVFALPRVLWDNLVWWLRAPRTCMKLWRRIALRRWKGAEKGGENLIAFLYAFRLARLFQRQGIEHVHAPWASGPATAAWTASSLLGIPFSFTARAWDIHPQDGALADKIRAAAFVRCNTRANIGYLQGVAGAGIDPDTIRLVYNGISLAARQDAAVAMRPSFRLLAVGRFVGKKGFEYLIQACGLLREQGVEVELTLAGAGPKGPALKRLTAELGLEDAVRFPGFVPHDEVARLYLDSDLFVMPSVIDSSGDRDGIPNVIMEALAHRLPVVATDVSGIAEVVEHGVTGLLAPQRDAGALARAVRSMVSDRERALGLAEAGRKRVLEMFDPERNYQAIVDLLREFTPSRSAGGQASGTPGGQAR